MGSVTNGLRNAINCRGLIFLMEKVVWALSSSLLAENVGVY